MAMDTTAMQRANSTMVKAANDARDCLEIFMGRYFIRGFSTLARPVAAATRMKLLV
jgi:hypothetical protein